MEVGPVDLNREKAVQGKGVEAGTGTGKGIVQAFVVLPLSEGLIFPPLHVMIFGKDGSLAELSVPKTPAMKTRKLCGFYSVPPKH